MGTNGTTLSLSAALWPPEKHISTTQMRNEFTTYLELGLSLSGELANETGPEFSATKCNKKPTRLSILYQNLQNDMLFSWKIT